MIALSGGFMKFECLPLILIRQGFSLMQNWLCITFHECFHPGVTVTVQRNVSAIEAVNITMTVHKH